jgi:N-acyl-D-aspartate/D-glutamate deacylase
VRELVVRGGLVVDGTGGAPRVVDVRVSGGVITEVGPNLHGDDVIDASGCIVAPGFIDVHTHYDAQVFWDPMFSSSCYHGVTSVIAGNCGFTLAPSHDGDRDLITRTLQAVEDMSLATLEAGVVWDFTSFGDYLQLIEQRGVGLNFGCYVGHSATRIFVMGDEAHERHATDDEIAQMRRHVGESIAAGAIGLSSSYSISHRLDGQRPVASRASTADEFIALASVLGELERGVAIVAPGAPVSYRDLYAMQPLIGRPCMWTPMITNFPEADYRDAMRVHAEGRATGADVYAQVSPRPLGARMTLAHPYMFRPTPSFQQIESLDNDHRRHFYRDAGWREQAWREMQTILNPRLEWSRIRVAESSVHPELVGVDLATIAGGTGQSPFDVYCELSLAEDLGTHFIAQVSNVDPDDVAALITQPGVLVGQSDAGAHVAQLCDATTPTDLLAWFVRDRGVLTIERAVRMLTGQLADLFGLRGRGVIAPGAAADIAVFDLERLDAGPVRRVRDLPGDQDRLVADQPVGQVHLLVNGQPVRLDERPLPPKSLSGQVLRPSS